MPVRKKELKLANKKNRRAEKNKRVAIKQGERTRRKAIKQGERTERDASYQKSERTKSRQNTKRTKSSNKTSTKKAIIAGLLERYKKKKAGKTKKAGKPSDTAKGIKPMTPLIMSTAIPSTLAPTRGVKIPKEYQKEKKEKKKIIIQGDGEVNY